ncbi:hypothetical protein BSKO_04968 [Bryopsis sp. KO-2023]|nr:hypothetical protein BSKO_04968 [Bryopsis sp. KO-2023]
MAEARMGYALFVDMANKMNGGRGIKIEDWSGDAHFFKFEFIWHDDLSNETLHDEQVERLLDVDKVDFLFGSHPEYARNETKIASRRVSPRINYHCCVGPDAIYNQPFPYVFGVSASNTKYTELAIQSMLLRGLERAAIIQRTDSDFTNSTCAAAWDVINRFEGIERTIKVVLLSKYTKEEATIPGVFDGFVRGVIRERVDAVIACSFQDDGEALVKAFHAARKSVKAFFLTTGPTKDDWVHKMGIKSDYLISAGQWHADLRYRDSFFGNGRSYRKKFQDFNGQEIEPTYLSAGASVVGYTTMLALQQAFSPCNISLANGDVDQLLFNETAISCDDFRRWDSGYQRVRKALADTNVETFYGSVRFNSVRRNVGMAPPTTQVLPYDEQSDRKIAAVLPVGAAEANLVMPARNLYRPNCSPGQYLGHDDFDPCGSCAPGRSSSEANSIHCDPCSLGSWVSKSGQHECNECPRGTTTERKGTSSIEGCFCKVGWYHPQGKSGEECKKCPDGATCLGGASPPEPLPGFWNHVDDVGNMFSCDPTHACVGGRGDLCARGHSGRVCKECEDGYFGVNIGCRRCPAPAIVVIVIVVLVMAWYVLNVVISTNMASLDMLLSWAQLANIVGDVGLNWPDKLSVMFSLANLLDFDVDILEPSCLTRWSFSHNFVVQLLFPLFMSFLALLGYVVAYGTLRWRQVCTPERYDAAKRWTSWLVTFTEDRNELAVKWDKTIAKFLVSVEVTYITVTKYCFDAFSCEDIAGVSVLRSAPSIECNTTEHSWLMVLGVGGTLFYSLGYLIFVAWKMIQLHNAMTFQEPANLRRYGFLYRRFELEYYWTPIVILVRRLVFVMVLTFLSNPAFQAGALAIVINASLMLQVYTAPYVDTSLDILFSFLLVTLMFESFGGVMFYSSNLPQANRVILEWIVLSIMFALFVVFFIFFVVEVVRKYQRFSVKRMHCMEILRRKGSVEVPAALGLLKAMSFEYREALDEVSVELLQTFDAGFIYRALRNRPECIDDWDTLTNMLKDQMSDQCPTSFLSLDSVAKFWRKLVDRFPELIDFLAVADEEARHTFCEFATTLFRDFYLTNKVEPLPVYRVLNWRDRAPMAQWLASASEAERRFFTTFMGKLFRGDNEETAQIMDAQVRATDGEEGHGGVVVFVTGFDRQFRSMCVTRTPV